MLSALLLAGLLSQSPPPIVHPTPPAPVAVKIAIGAQMVTAGIDYGTTMYAMGRGYREMNPVWRWAQDRPVAMGATKLTIHTLISYALLRDADKHPKRTFWIALGITAVNTAAFIHNSRTVK